MARKASGTVRVIGYIRVSTDEQSLGPEAQRESIEQWCKTNSAELVSIHEDIGVSGGLELDKRPALLAALDALRPARASVLLVAKRDRLARDVMVAAMVGRLTEKAGARVLTADGSANGEGPEASLMRSIIDAFAEYERALIRARTRAALAIKRGRHERTGEVPFGSRLSADGVHLEPHAGEAEIVSLIRQLRAEGLTIRGIAERLNLAHAPGRGSKWHATSVARVLARETA